MSTTFGDSGLSVADVQSLMLANLNSTILFVFCHGIHTYIFLVTLYYIAQSAHSDRKRITFGTIITFLWCANTIIMGLTWNTMNEIFITHGTSLEAEFSFSCVGQCVSRGSAVIVVRVLAVFLADFILILRCWVLYGGDFRIVAAPILCLITETISACYVLFYFATAGTRG
ncbi:hypothetical protein BDZ89DRAFT_73460 [Hymenopellis radicata]|nr:hypothetical protein BDZ89DRAFT_73460 [Hymenopellis radicata]